MSNNILQHKNAPNKVQNTQKQSTLKGAIL